MNEQEQRIREFAYEIWQTEGCPEGQGERHWEMARKLVEAQDSGIPVSQPAGKPRKSATKPVDVTTTNGAEPVSSQAAQPGTEQPGTEQPAEKAKAPKAAKPAKAAAAAKGSAKPKPAAGTDAAEGTPAGVKKTRAPRAKKDS